MYVIAYFKRNEIKAIKLLIIVKFDTRNGNTI